MIVIVPDSLHDEINRRLESVYRAMPEAAVEREQHYSVLLDYFNEHGVLPDFSITKTDAINSAPPATRPEGTPDSEPQP